MATTDSSQNAESVPMRGQNVSANEKARRHALWQEHMRTTPVVLYALQDQHEFTVNDGIESGLDFTSRYLGYRQGDKESLRVYALTASSVEQSVAQIWFRMFQTTLPELDHDHITDLIVDGTSMSCEVRSTETAWFLLSVLGNDAVVAIGSGAVPRLLRLRRVDRLVEALL